MKTAECPVVFEMKVYVRGGGNEGVATYILPSGKYPTKKMVEEGLRAVEQQLEGTELRLCTKSEFVNAIVSEKTNGMAPRVATPGGNEWSPPYTDDEP